MRKVLPDCTENMQMMVPENAEFVDNAWNVCLQYFENAQRACLKCGRNERRCIENVLLCVKHVLKVCSDWRKYVRGRAECMLIEGTAEITYRKQWISESTLMH